MTQLVNNPPAGTSVLETLRAGPAWGRNERAEFSVWMVFPDSGFLAESRESDAEQADAEEGEGAGFGHPGRREDGE